MLSPSKPVGAIALASACGIAVAIAGPARAATFTFDFITDPQLTTSTRPFASTPGGVNLTVDNAVGINQPGAVSTVGSGGVNTDKNNGLCASFLTGTGLSGTGKCQYEPTTDASLTGLTFTFDQDVTLKSFDILRGIGVTKGSLLFTSGSLSEELTFENPGGSETPNGVVLTTLVFNSLFKVAANTPIEVDTSKTEYLPGETGSFRINSFVVKTNEVPGPLPLFGVAAAFSYSRKLRNKLKTR
jgi:hypothetical protein